jgi:phosphatidylserine/phosphatidylglycerophosphate/cardiolipin synthase-like enzyme
MLQQLRKAKKWGAAITLAEKSVLPFLRASLLLGLAGFSVIACRLEQQSSRVRFTPQLADGIGSHSQPYGGSCNPDGSICALFTPTDMPINAVAALLMSAKKTIRISTYNIDRPEFVGILEQKLKDPEFESLELVVDYAHVARGHYVYDAFPNQPKLKKLRAPVFRGGNPQMHNKMIAIDNHTVIFGSANFTESGLVGNFENVMIVRQRADLLSRLLSEMDEIRDLALLACNHFAEPAEACGSGEERWDRGINELLTKGIMPRNWLRGISTNASVELQRCLSLSDRRSSSLLIGGNQPLFPVYKDFVACFSDQKIAQRLWDFAQEAAKIDRYGDGTPVAEDPPKVVWRTSRDAKVFPSTYFQHRDNQRDNFRIYFSGEDNIEYQLVRELKRLHEIGNAKDSFLYTSTNFITHRGVASEINKLREKGGRLRVFIDRGRIEDRNFHSQLYWHHGNKGPAPDGLAELGMTWGLGARSIKEPLVWIPRAEHNVPEEKWLYGSFAVHDDPQMIDSEEHIDSKMLSIFNNTLGGSYGALHNKFAIMGTRLPDGKYEVTLVNGSANWSVAAMEQNDESLIVVKDSDVVTLFAKEILSQLFVYRYGQSKESQAFRRDLEFLASRFPCLKAHLGLENSCKDASGKEWRPVARASLFTTAEKTVPLTAEHPDLWACVLNFDSIDGNDRPMAFQFFTGKHFDGKWMTSIPAQINWGLRFKLVKAARFHTPKCDGSDGDKVIWEGGFDRVQKTGSLGVLYIRQTDLGWQQ